MDNKRIMKPARAAELVRQKIELAAAKLDALRSRETSENDAARHLANSARGLGWTLLAFLFSGARLAMGTYPLGLSLLCASRETLPFTYIGCTLAAIFNKGLALPMFVVYTLVFGFRVALAAITGNTGRKSPPFRENIAVRMIAAAVAGFTLGVWILFADGFLLYDLFGAAFLIVISPVATLLYACAAGECDGGMKYKALLGEAGGAALIFSLVVSLGDVSFLGFSLACTAAMFLTLLAAKGGGALRGCVAGLVCGIAFDPVLAPVFAVSGLAAGALMNHSPAAATAASLASGCAYLAYIAGGERMLVSLPDMLAAAVVFLPLARLGLLPRVRLLSGSRTMPESATRESAVALRSGDELRERMGALSQSMEELSVTFRSLSDKLRRPSQTDIARTCDRISGEYCASCRLNSLCWDKEYASTVDFMGKMARTLAKKGSVRCDELPAYIVERCPEINAIVAGLNHTYAELLETAVEKDKTGVFALDYESMAKLLSETVKANEDEFVADSALTAKLNEALGYLGFHAENAVVFGKRRKYIVAGGVDLARMRVSADEMRTCFESVCGCRFDCPQFHLNGDYITMTMKSVPRFAAEYARAGLTKETESVNGDTVNLFEGRDGYFYALLSDGMGSGKDASLTSRMTAIILEKLLSGGGGKALALSMLNNFIRNKGVECFATVDLLEVDLLSGSASFIKSGAAPSYIIREGSLFRVSSDSMPVGITGELNSEEIRFTLERGDVVVMMSDGVIGSDEDAAWLCNMITYEWDSDLRRMSEKLLAAAKSRFGRSDDMTLGMVRILPAAR